MPEPANVLPFDPAPEGVEVRHLRAFVAVAEELNFSRAAERLYLSQPALSRQIRALERAVGCELLRRTTHSVELTLAGAALLDRTRPVLAALDEAVAAAQSVGGELAARIMRLWAPVLAVATSETSVESMREVFESFLARLPVPPEVPVRPVTAGGVPALVLGDEPAILYLHGGGYVLGSAYGYRSLAGALVAAAGRGALVADYRLAPEHPFPAAVDDALAAYRWLAERRGRVALAGDSSGAALALCLMQRLKAAGEPLPAAAALLCPSIEAIAPPLLAHLPYFTEHPPGTDLSGLPSLLIQAATGDRACPEAQALAERARAQGVDTRLELFPTDVHAFHVFWSFLPEAADALAQAGEFLERWAGRP